MTDSPLYNSVFVRKSVRKYKPDPLPAEALNALEERIHALRPLPGAPVAVRVLEPAQIGGRFAVRAPHYLAVYAPEDDASLMACGYALQQLELFLVAQGWGACYCGMAKADSGAHAVQNLECRMLLAFGQPDENPRRSSTKEFDRLPAASICTPGTPEALVEAVRLAPSAVNRQNWFLSGDESRIDVYRGNRGGLVAMMARRLGWIDLGIALAHLDLAAGELGRECVFDFAAKPQDVPKGMQYACTALLTPSS